MNWDYSPEAGAESRILYRFEPRNDDTAAVNSRRFFQRPGEALRIRPLAHYGLSCTAPKTVPGMFGGIAVVLTAFVVISKISTLPPSTT